ncbi:MAG TPA: ribosome assembly cofactor RimP [Prolixibacteraceae bacterium]|mgnify:CR=1 FL=1|nr:ribosome assembly cofactor RimP [Prolixibacteraceae bacterium]HPR60347.1 ribosome assembly cofactor RimP [Prolixibacteraceae bacterium]
MISKEQIEALALNALTDEYFIVDISVKKGNVIEVTIDGDQGVSIQKCVDVSRSIESNLDREAEDFELSVSSAGLGKPFKVKRQYVKNIGNEVEVVSGEGKPLAGIIAAVDDEGFDLETKTKEKAADSKKKVEVIRSHRFLFSSKPKVRNIISFK